MPIREDCWSEEATETLVQAWGDRYLELNRGNLRQKDWQDVAAAVNARHGHSKKSRRTDIQCKNRVDTVKKKYKIEKGRVVESGGAYVSPWPLFARLDSLTGDSMKKIELPERKGPSSSPSLAPSLALTAPVPVGPRSAKTKRPAVMNESFFRRNFAAVATAAAAEEEESDWERSRSSGETECMAARRRPLEEDDGYRQLAKAIERFGEIYERVEETKQQRLIELEKHRMQFAQELEFQRMELLMDIQRQLVKIKRRKHSHPPVDNDAGGGLVTLANLL